MELVPRFVLVACHQGAEAALKSEFALQGWRLAYSRPGFVSFKEDENTSAKELPSGVFARQVAWSLGRVTAEQSTELAAELIDLVRASVAAQKSSANRHPSLPFNTLHLWGRDRLPVGQRGYQPRREPLTDAFADAIYPALCTAGIVSGEEPQESLQRGQTALDVIFVDPGIWMVGWHPVTAEIPTRWCGAFPPLAWDQEVVSRAYFKAAEAIVWSALPLRPGDTVVEVGSAPGGAAQRLLELGMQVVGIDPAEMAPEILAHPNFVHIKARGGDIKRNEYRDARWLLVDSNVRPDKTLVTVENIVMHRQVHIQGMLLTMKLGRYDQADRIAKWCRTIRGWGFSRIRVRQLATGRCEVCIAAQRVARDEKKLPSSSSSTATP